MRWLVMTGVMLATWCASALPAAAATLEIRHRDVWLPGWAEPRYTTDIVYDGAGTEANRITVAPQPERSGIVLTDPGIPIQTVFTTPPPPSTSGELLMMDWTCASPGHSVAACESYPGSNCWSGGCAGPNPGYYNGLLKIAGNAGDDVIRILPSDFNSEVWGVYGNDTINVRNLRIDNVSCGAGTDSATVDAKDIVQSDCEVVSRG